MNMLICCPINSVPDEGVNTEWIHVLIRCVTDSVPDEGVNGFMYLYVVLLIVHQMKE